MLGAAIGAVLTPGVGAAISPMSIIAVLLILAAPSSGRNAVAFLTGSVLGLALICTAVVLVSNGAGVDHRSGPSKTASVVQLVLAVLFAYLAWTNWRKRPHAGTETSTPKWMRAIATLTPFGAARLGLLLSAANLKNLPLSITAATAVAQTGVGAAGSTIALAIYIALGCLGIAAPIAAARYGPPAVNNSLSAARSMLLANNAVILAVLFAVLAANNTAHAVTGLTA